jgi:leucyl aminopeptidase
MKVGAVTGDITQIKAGAVVVSFFAGSEHLDANLTGLDKLLDGAISNLVAQGEIKGRLNEVTLVHTLGRLPSARVVIAGLGKATELTRDRVRGAVAESCRRLQEKWVDSVAVAPLGAGSNGIKLEEAAQAVIEGALLGAYSFRSHMTGEAERGEIREMTLVVASDADLPPAGNGCNRGRILAEAANYARDLVNEPANNMTPQDMAGKAAGLAEKHGLKLTVLERDNMRELGMGGLLGVARGSEQPPKFIVLEYRGTDRAGIDLALVGKGITFDSGGISIKPSERMGEMKGDMAGGASVMAVIGAVAQLKPGINVAAIIPATENLPSGTALKPGDILTAMNGKTMEIISTDAEGRLVLADALCYANKLGTGRIVDVATLTGACIVALGNTTTGAFTNNQELMDRVAQAANEAGELVWQMPMYEQYRELIKSDVADIKNVGGRAAGAITAAKFLAEFAGDTPWVHLDIAGPSMTDKEQNYWVKGATGVPVRTLVNLVLRLAEEKN